MSNTRELRRRIKSVKSTAQITKAMQMVAATKMRRAQNQALNGRPYNLNLGSALKKLLPLVQIESHPLLQSSESKKIGVILLSTDKSLCGALNTNLFRMLNNSTLPSDTIFYTIGRKGRDFVVKSGKNLSADFENFDLVNFRQAKQLAKLVVESFRKNEIGEVYVAYPDFKSTLRQEPKLSKVLPIRVEEIMEYVTEEEHQKDKQSLSKEGKIESKGYLFEPNPEVLLEYILLHHIDIIRCSIL